MRPIVLTTLLLLLSSAASAAEIYCLDNGKDCSDRPTPGAEVIRTDTRRPATQPAEPAATETAPASNTSEPAPDVSTDTRVALQKDMDQVRAERCKKAQEAYQQSLQARRIYRTNKDGEREYLSDKEADQLRLNARVEMEQSCGPANR